MQTALVVLPRDEYALDDVGHFGGVEPAQNKSDACFGHLMPFVLQRRRERELKEG